MTVYKFTGKHRKEMIDPKVAEMLKSQLDAFPNLPESTKWELQRVLNQNTAAECNWTFIMLSPQQNASVVKWLTHNSKRRNEAVLLWAEMFTSMRMDTGEIMMSRDELSEAVGTSASNVSRIMSELESINAVSRRRVRIPGVKGPGRVHYFMNPNVATGVAGNKGREEAQADAGQLNIFDVIDGGKVGA